LNTRPTLDLLREHYGALPPVRNPAYFQSNSTAAVLDGSRARDRLGFEARINWREMVSIREASKRKTG
jgi:hypothetical protein